jgi:galactose mutarotase-like enzyme
MQIIVSFSSNSLDLQEENKRQHMLIQKKNFSIETSGAELLKLSNSKGTQLLWGKQTDHWNRIAPHLFPIVGKLVNDEYKAEGNYFTLPQHGFARDNSFTVIHESDSRIILELQSNVTTLSSYPYLFTFQVRYEWIDEALRITYVTFNRGHSNMYYSVGGHPAFHLDEPLENYYLEFDVAIQLERQELQGSHFTGGASYYGVSNHLPLSNELFEKDAFVLNHPECKTVRLKNQNGNTLVTISCENWTALGIWTKPGAPFICIEPWWGWADHLNHSGKLEEKGGIRTLAPGQSESLSFVIGV